MQDGIVKKKLFLKKLYRITIRSQGPTINDSSMKRLKFRFNIYQLITATYRKTTTKSVT